MPYMVATRDPILVADVVLDAALAAGADTVTIEPARQSAHYTIAVARNGELLAVSTIDAKLAIPAIARLGYVCNVDPASARIATGRNRVRSCDTQRDLVVTIVPGELPRAELMFVSPGTRPSLKEPVANERIGHYQVLARIGAGGMGDVYEVEHVTLRRRAALKILQHEVIARDAASGERFLLEAQATARIKSPHVVEVYDFGYLADGRPYFVMELLSAQSLGDVLDRGALQIPRALSVARQIAVGLCAAHAQGVVHADVTPSNVLVAADAVKLIDFGLAQLRERIRPTGLADEITGTPSYVSPEQLQGHAAIEASDQYSLGCVLFEMMAGHPPFDGESTTSICLDHVRRPPPRASSVHGTVSSAIASVVARCLAKDPKKRYPSMRALADAIAAVERA
jgi:serine/threonine protein kinase